MARKTKLRPEEVAEIDATKRKELRNNGFSMMRVRDRGWGTLIDHKNKKEVVLMWNLPQEEDGHMFKLKSGEHEMVLDWEQFQRLARWI